MSYFKSAKPKTASLRDMWNAGKDLLKQPEFRAPAVAMGATAGLAVGTKGLSALRDTIDTKRSYNKTLELHPHLKKEDPGKMKRYFSTLKTFAPSMAKDPTVAGAWISNIMAQDSAFDGEAGSQALLGGVKDLAGITANRGRMGGGRPDPVFAAGKGLIDHSAGTYVNNKLEALRAENKVLTGAVEKSFERGVNAAVAQMQQP